MKKNYAIRYMDEYKGCVIYTKVLSKSGKPLYMDDREGGYKKLKKALLTVVDEDLINTGVTENESVVKVDESHIPMIVDALEKAGYTRILPSVFY